LLQALWRRKIVAAAVALVVLLGGATAILTRPKVYQSEATVSLYPMRGNDAAVNLYSQFVENLLTTYAQLLKSRTFLNGVAEQLSFGTTGQQLQSQVSASSVPNAAVLRIQARSSNPRHAQEIATDTTSRFIATVSDGRVVNVVVTDEPQVPTSASTPDPTLALGALVIVALLFGGAAALATDRLFPTVDTPAVLATLAGLPRALVIPYEAALTANPGFANGTRGNAVVERAFRGVCNELLRTIRSTKPPTAVALVGLKSGVGVSTLAANLSITCAAAGHRVLLVDANGEDPRQAAIFGVSDSQLPARPRKKPAMYSGPYGLKLTVATDEPLVGRLAAFEPFAEVTLVDCPPLSDASSDAVLLAAEAGTAIVVVSAGARTSDVNDALEYLRAIDATVVAGVLSKVDRRHRRLPRWMATPFQRPSRSPLPGSTDPPSTDTDLPLGEQEG